MTQLVCVLQGDARCAGVLEGEQVRILDGMSPEELVTSGSNIDMLPGTWFELDGLRLDVPLRPPVLLCAGQNYHDHLAEKAPVDLREPEFFLKSGQTIAPLDQPIEYTPAITRKLDYETELGVVIGRTGRNIDAKDALQYVFGYVVANDLTARDRQVIPKHDGGFTMALGPGKNFDGATRLGALLVTSDSILDPHNLSLRTIVSDELRQSNTTRNMIFSIAEIIAYLSTLLTLHPGTIILTGTPGGTGWGADPALGGTGITPDGCAPAHYLQLGDTLISEVEAIGRLECTVTGGHSDHRGAGPL